MFSWRGVQQKHTWLFLLLILFAFALRLWDLDARSLWFDESMEYWVAQPPLPTAIRAIQIGIQDPPLYSLALHLWMGLGAGDFYLRFLSVCVSVLSVAGMIRLAQRSFGFGAGASAGLVMALLPTEIRYAQEVGQYAPMVCALVWNLIALDGLVRKRTWQAYGFWALTMLVGMYSYYGTLLPLHIPFGIVVLNDLWTKNKNNLLKDFGASAIYALGLLPLIIFFIPAQLFRPSVAARPPLQFMALQDELRVFLIGTQHLLSFQFTGWPWSSVPEWIASLIFAAGFVSTTVYALKHPATPQRQFWLWLTVTWLAYYALIRLHLFAWDEGLYGFRYALILTPLLLIVMSAGLTQLWRYKRLRPMSVALIVTFVAISLVSLPNRTFRDWAFGNMGWQWPETADVRAVAQYWLAERDQREPTYIYYGAVPAFRYYLHSAGQDNSPLPPAWFRDCWFKPSPADCAFDGVYYGAWIRQLPPARLVASMTQTLGRDPERFWIVFAEVYPNEDNLILEQLSAHYRIERSYKQGRDSAYLFAKR